MCAIFVRYSGGASEYEALSRARERAEHTNLPMASVGVALHELYHDLDK